MAVICATCSTANREGAMFCRGCLGKLPAFVATGPAALDLMRSLGHGVASLNATPPRGAQASLPPAAAPLFESRAFWLRAGGLALMAIVGIVAWYAWVTRPVPPVGLPASAAAARTVLPEAVAGTAPAQRPFSKTVPAGEALGPGEALAPRGPAAAQAPAAASAPVRAPEIEWPPAQQPVAQQQALVQRRPPLPGPSPVPAPRGAAADPRAACAGLNFVAAARCEMAQCASPAYSQHPHCNAVREQTRRDVARRDPSY